MQIRIVPEGDLDLPNGTTAIVDGAACAVQHTKIALDIFLGEWFLDLRVGISYFRDVLVHSPNADIVRSVFRQGVLKTPGIVSVPEIEVTLDSDKRIASVDFVAIYQDGTTVPGTKKLII